MIWGMWHGPADYDVVGSTSEVCSKLIATPFGYVLAGRTVGSGFQRAFLLGLSPLGDVLWSRVYGVSGDVHTAPHTYVKNLIALDDGFLFTWADRDRSMTCYLPVPMNRGLSPVVMSGISRWRPPSCRSNFRPHDPDHPVHDLA